MRAAWLFDIGSTFTKITVVYISAGLRLASAQSPTTVETDVRVGMMRAIASIERDADIRFIDAALRRASSSAAGGLALVASGLVPRLSLEAARIAALGAGAKVVGTWGYRLGGNDLKELVGLRPDVILLTGGTDGGDRRCVLENAKALARVANSATVVIACNRDAVEEVVEVLGTAGCKFRTAPNILPEVDRINVEPVRQVIRDIFLEEIIFAKGIDLARDMLDGEIMPTPYVVLRAVEYVAEAVFGSETMAIEVGGATTNVHSFAEGAPRDSTTVTRGFTEPRLKRTVEGDLGVRYNANTILETASSVEFVSNAAGLPASSLQAYVARIRTNLSCLPMDDEEHSIDEALAAYCARTAIARHCGRLEQVRLLGGIHYLQRGKDLRDIGTLLFTGGSLINARNLSLVVTHVLGQQDLLALTPRHPTIYLDRDYVLYASGLLALSGEYGPAAATLRGSLVGIPVTTVSSTGIHAHA
jgi:uncharacterized protein (TIGR01319 family)